jgi:STE24 endopeptidase
MNAIGFIVLAALLVEFALRLLADGLNLRAARQDLPDGLKTVYSPERYRASQDYLRVRTRFRWFSSAVFLGALLSFWFGGGFELLDGWVRSSALNPVARGLLYIGILALFRSMLGLPFHVYATFVIEKRFGFNTTGWRTFAADGLKAGLLSVILGGPLLALVLGLLEYAGSYAWLFAWFGAAIFLLGAQFIAPRWILPLFNTFAPLPEGELRSAIMRYARSIDFPLENIFVMDGSRRTTKSNAFLAGFGKHRRAVLFDTLVGEHTLPEAIAVLAHEIGHHKKHHILKSLALGILHTGVLFYLFSLVASSQELFAAFGVERISTYGGLVFFSLLIAPADLALGILLNALSRRREREADRFSVATTGRRASLADALRKLSAHNLANPCPHPFFVALHYSHPPLSARIREIEDLEA